jgi:hypothetical protein
VGKCGGEEDVTGGSDILEGAKSPTCVLCNAAASAIVECDAHVILIRHGAGLALAPRRHVARWRDLSAAEQAALANRIGRRQVSCTVRDIDRYGRFIAVCHQDSTDLNAWLVREGWAVAGVGKTWGSCGCSLVGSG